jgi:acetyl esterase/lipase
MSEERTPLVPPGTGGLGARILRAVVRGAMRATLLVSPTPAALLVRKAFAADGAKTAAALARHAPKDVDAVLDVRYGDEPEMLLDVFRPASASGRLPVLVWIHGGGFVGGAKEEIAGYLEVVASHGFAVVGPRYSLAPGHRYPTPPRPMMAALAYLQADAERLGVDATRIGIAGDSAGAHIAAQLAALVTTPGYAERVGVTPTIARHELRCLVLACGPYDLRLARHPATPAGKELMRTVLWAYSGTRRYLDDPSFAPWSIPDNVTAAFPPALVTVGNADPLRPHSERLAEALRTAGAHVETVLFADGHEPPLDHEYQFDLDSDAGQLFLERLVAFLRRRLGPIGA